MVDSLGGRLSEFELMQIAGISTIYVCKNFEARLREEEEAKRAFLEALTRRHEEVHVVRKKRKPPVRMAAEPKQQREDGGSVRFVKGVDGKTHRERKVDGRYVPDEVTVLEEIPPELRKVLRSFSLPGEEYERYEAWRKWIKGKRLQDDDDILLAAASMRSREVEEEEDDVQSYTPAQGGVMPSEAFYGGLGKRIGWMDAEGGGAPDL